MVHGSPSSQLTGKCSHMPSIQISSVHGFPSSQFIGMDSQTPLTQMSSVQGSPSSQITGVLTQALPIHSSMVHRSLSSQFNGGTVIVWTQLAEFPHSSDTTQLLNISYPTQQLAWPDISSVKEMSGSIVQLSVTSGMPVAPG
jgi:hypothetical protein